MKAFTSFFGFIPTEEMDISNIELFKAGLFRRLIPVDDLGQIKDCLANRYEYGDDSVYIIEGEMYYGVNNNQTCTKIYMSLDRIEKWAKEYFNDRDHLVPDFLKNINFDWKDLKQGATKLMTHDWDDNVFF